MKIISFCERYMLTTAVLERFKTNTRRLEKALERAVTEYEKKWGKSFSIVSQYYDKGFDKIGICTPNEPIYLSTRYKLGEVVAVAQSYEDIYHHGGPEYGSYELVNNYRRLHIKPWKDITQQAGWSNKMFVRPDLMPHQIQIMDVRIERLQDISNEDCLKEGIIIKTIGDFGYYAGYGYGETRASSLDETFSTPRKAFAALINRPGVGRKGLWQSNPWVVVYTFKLIK